MYALPIGMSFICHPDIDFFSKIEQSKIYTVIDSDFYDGTKTIVIKDGDVQFEKTALPSYNLDQIIERQINNI